jgi:1-acyl-sn-glycerol-3-phosphate acyltransferase
MIIRARHHPVISPFFTRYAKRSIKKRFHRVVIQGEYRDKKLPLLLVANHMSWWDGLWLNYLNAKVFKRKFHFMMLEDQLRKHWYFRHAGGFSVKKGTRSVMETMAHAAELLSDSGSLVLMFPQGEIQSLYTVEFQFEKGIEYILSRTRGEVQLIFAANLIEYFSKPRPSLFTYLEEYSGNKNDTKEIESAYNRFYQACINKNRQMKEI